MKKPDGSPRRKNALLQLLDREGDYSVANLKRHFRRLCKETHPDLGGTGNEEFLALGALYREALAALRSGAAGGASAAAGVTATAAATVAPGGRGGTAKEAPSDDAASVDPRSATFQSLRTYAFRFRCSDSGLLLDRLIAAASAYDQRLCRLLEGYKAEFLDSVHSWMAEGRVYYAHALLLSCVKQLFYYYDTGAFRHRLLLERYVADAKKRAEHLEEGRKAVLDGLSDWLLDEADRPPVFPED